MLEFLKKLHYQAMIGAEEIILSKGDQNILKDIRSLIINDGQINFLPESIGDMVALKH